MWGSLPVICFALWAAYSLSLDQMMSTWLGGVLAMAGLSGALALPLIASLLAREAFPVALAVGGALATTATLQSGAVSSVFPPGPGLGAVAALLVWYSLAPQMLKPFTVDHGLKNSSPFQRYNGLFSLGSCLLVASGGAILTYQGILLLL